ncbi:hypothetical protein BDQ94DRAFT_164415 [Aspergillus welwitschiae]|uniref:Uncharacterized protein n=1 Tax=Aspergillus welwitschiae TaxID=1341132 RepID=A0A3F3PHU8_9EURO|nr:hypothetical protein BDQ94DRAFT_164415 [Aspergillus welwitschiae]RDH26530.1 hypothetical protein BDQ94DRAFT_164415 [Aspergillus welwitschiae]
MPPGLSDLYEQATQIQSVDWYGIWVAALLGVWLLTRLAYQLGRCRGSSIDISTAFEAILVGVLLGANIVLLLVSAHGWAHVQQRAAKLTVLNLLLLGMGLIFGLPAHLLGISQTQSKYTSSI